MVSVAVNLDDADPAGSTGLIEGHLALTYNAQEFTVTAADIHLGSLLAGTGWSMVPTIDPATGQIGIALSSASPITSQIGGSLVTIDFHPVGRIANPSSITLVASVNPRGQYIATELEDAQGTFTLTPAPRSASMSESLAALTAATTGVGATALTPAPVLVEIRAEDSATIDGPGSTASGSTDNAPPAVADASSINEAVHAVPASSTVTVSTLSSATAVLQAFGGIFLVNVQASTAPHLADPLFQTLVRETALPSLSLVGVRDAFERSLAGQMLLPSRTESLNGVNWEEADSGLEWQGLGGPTAMTAPAAQMDHPSTPPASDAEMDVYQAALDLYFAEEE
jgi:hypothetical protein